MLRRSLGQFSRADESGLDHAIDQAGHPTGCQGDVGTEPAHGQAPLRARGHVDQDVEVDEGYPD